MIGLLFIYWIWKAFSNLAIEYNKNKWKYFFFGIVSYYASSVIVGFVLAIVMGFINGFDSVANENYDTSGWNLFFVFFGGLGCYGAYKFLERKGEKERELVEKEGIDSIGLFEEN
ncbi:hypothetical protein EOD40_03825 [Flavobacterium sufflavum]|uniref:Uncharacterized protein n=1 Tax=Flavobacterium sufflavum TaxID=1921138 RepID=A0A3S2V6F7_9FLAO|nr:hypothetical protein [Flavobacterium sufflavum]RVT78373.1 hypothetical protein EOD40_03825 [Flavobacterium sufflavum]